MRVFRCKRVTEEPITILEFWEGSAVGRLLESDSRYEELI